MKTITLSKDERLKRQVAQPSKARPVIAYNRDVQLAKLLPLWPHEIEDRSSGARLKITGKLRQALRAERRRGRAGLWTYDLNRHIALLEALAGEMRLSSGAEHQDDSA
ncbi:MAG: DUF6477 family protein [Hyphomicrobiales bacterium]|nr:DUF6477 family protein [Hyphomicrobiales bacterium]